MLNPVGEELWTVEGPIVSFYSFPYPTRMAVARLANRQLWLWSPIALTSELAEELEKLGEVRHLVAPNKLHQVVIGGSFVMNEVVFFHRPSRSALVCDLIQKHDKSAFSGWRRWAMQLDGMVGPDGSTPREWRATFTNRAVARAGRDTMLDWNPRQLIIAHGPIIRENAKDVIASSLAWIG